jgi:signal peptidase I
MKVDHIKNITKYALFVGLVLLFSFGIVVLVTSLKTQRSLLPKVFIVSSGSMASTIKRNSMIVVKPVPEYSVGDIVTYRSLHLQSMVVTHRIVRTKALKNVISGSFTELFFTKGDANDFEDVVPINKREIIGKVVFILGPIALGILLYVPLGFTIGRIVYATIRSC